MTCGMRFWYTGTGRLIRCSVGVQAPWLFAARLDRTPGRTPLLPSRLLSMPELEGACITSDALVCLPDIAYYDLGQFMTSGSGCYLINAAHPMTERLLTLTMLAME
jgi:hypothetical protein